jgi:hypothetical protein
MRAKTTHPLGSQPASCLKPLAQLAQPGWICQGTVVSRALRRRVKGQWVQKGPYYLWTGKRQGKTVCFALSKAQYEMTKAAIAANRRVMKALAKLQTVTFQHILKRIPGVQKRK